MSITPCSSCLLSCLVWLASIQTSQSFFYSNLPRLERPPTSAIMSTSRRTNDWSPLNPESLVSAKCLIEQTLCVSSDQGPRLAKDVDYASAILEAWQEHLQDLDQDSTPPHDQVEYKSVMYDEKDEGVPLHGYLVRKRYRKEEHEATDGNDARTSSSPAIVFFHTGAGPHDIFLLWKAASLILSPQLDSIDCQVLIADVIGDDSGWVWEDQPRYQAARDHLLQEECSASQVYYRPVLQKRIHAALSYLSDQPDVDSTRLAALGWCLGGHAILELGRMRLPNLLALVSFHGVFAGATSSSYSKDEAEATNAGQAEVLICHGVNDPFVDDAQLQVAMSTFQDLGHWLSLLQLQAKHGFTNPAQAYNENPSFAYSQQAADKAWRQAMNLLQRNVDRSKVLAD